MKLMKLPTAHAAERGVGEEVAGVGVEEEVAFAGPADVGGEGEAEDFGEGGGFEQADLVVVERGEQRAIA